MDDFEELRRCPFCAGFGNPKTNLDRSRWVIECYDCDARTGEYDTEEEAIEAWETREKV